MLYQLVRLINQKHIEQILDSHVMVRCHWMNWYIVLEKAAVEKHDSMHKLSIHLIMMMVWWWWRMQQLAAPHLGTAAVSAADTDFPRAQSSVCADLLAASNVSPSGQLGSLGTADPAGNREQTWMPHTEPLLSFLRYKIRGIFLEIMNSSSHLRYKIRGLFL